MIFALSSACSDLIIQPTWVLALAKQQARLAKWWGIDAAHVVYTTRIGEFDDPGACDVQIVPDWGAFPGVDPRDIAFHTIAGRHRGQQGRPVCYISWAAIEVNGGTLTGPDGLLSAIAHEMCEAAIDPTCARLVTNPAGQQEPVEVCDRIQGTDYEEDGSPGLWLANALGPAAFQIGAHVIPQYFDIASDLRTSAIISAFPLTPGGYYAPNDAPPIFGDRAPAHLVERVMRLGARSGARKAARA